MPWVFMSVEMGSDECQVIVTERYDMMLRHYLFEPLPGWGFCLLTCFFLVFVCFIAFIFHTPKKANEQMP